jgi:hypothetical protein
MVKASDFRSVFGNVSQHAPVFRHSRVQSNLPVRGANANSLKFQPSICSQCNNTRTQPHDRAWQALSSAIRQHSPGLRRGSLLPTAQAFQGQAKREMLNVHFYFLKLLGCYAVEHSVPLPVSAFAVAILGGYAYPNVRLNFVAVQSRAGQAEVFVSGIRAINRGPRTVGANWFYIVGTAGVLVTYQEAGQPRFSKHPGWQPDDIGLDIRMR